MRLMGLCAIDRELGVRHGTARQIVAEHGIRPIVLPGHTLKRYDMDEIEEAIRGDRDE